MYCNRYGHWMKLIKATTWHISKKQKTWEIVEKKNVTMNGQEQQKYNFTKVSEHFYWISHMDSFSFIQLIKNRQHIYISM